MIFYIYCEMENVNLNENIYYNLKYLYSQIEKIETGNNKILNKKNHVLKIIEVTKKTKDNK